MKVAAKEIQDAQDIMIMAIKSWSDKQKFWASVGIKIKVHDYRKSTVIFPVDSVTQPKQLIYLNRESDE